MRIRQGKSFICGIAPILFILFVVCGCTSPVDIQLSPSPALQESDETAQVSAVILPEEIDPLGFYQDEASHSLTGAELAGKYGAQIKMMPDTYEIPNYYLGDCEARTFITTYKGHVRQVASMQQDEIDSAKSAVYQTMVEALGAPDIMYRFDYDDTAIPIKESELFVGLNPCCARWYMDDRTIEIGEETPGNHVDHWYVAVYQDRLDFRAMFGYDFPCSDCPHGADVYFDPTGIYMDSELFEADAKTMIDRYAAQEVACNERQRSSADDIVTPSDYIVKGLRVFGYDADFVIHSYSDDELSGGMYLIELDDGTIDMEAQDLFLSIAQVIDSSVATEKSLEDSLEWSDLLNVASYQHQQGTLSTKWTPPEAGDISLIYVKEDSHWSNWGSYFSPESWYIAISLMIR